MKQKPTQKINTRTAKATHTGSRKTSNRLTRQPVPATGKRTNVSRILVGVRIEDRLASVMRGLAELYDLPLGELIEQVFLAAMEGQNFFAGGRGTIPHEVAQKIKALKSVFALDYSAADILRPNRKPKL